jgi:hypothetical protein
MDEAGELLKLFRVEREERVTMPQPNARLWAARIVIDHLSQAVKVLANVEV